MKITVYTITECQFSKQEKEYLSSHGLQFQEKNLETNREFLTEMLAVGGNFAGTPVTKIEKDDGQIVVLKGFTAAEFDKTLGKTPDVGSVKPAESVQVEQPTAPVVEVTPVAAPVEAVAPAQTAPEVVAPAPVVPDPAMASVLNTLEQQAAPPAPLAPVAPQAPAAPMPAAPIIPDPQF